MLVQQERSERGVTTIPLPEGFLSASQMQPGATVDLTLIDGKILVAPVHRSKYSLDELMADVTEENIHPEVDFGPPVGNEVSD